MSIKSRLQRLEQSLPPVDDGRFEEMRRILGLIRADPVAHDAFRALAYAEMRIECRDWQEDMDWQKKVLWKDSPHVVAAIESDDPRSALLALVEQRTGVQLSDGSS